MDTIKLQSSYSPSEVSELGHLGSFRNLREIDGSMMVSIKNASNYTLLVVFLSQLRHNHSFWKKKVTHC